MVKKDQADLAKRGRPRKIPVGEDYLSKLTNRMNECEEVVRHLETCPAFSVIIKDLNFQKELIDNNWHLTNDEVKLKEFRITKFAIMHLLNLRNKYSDELIQAKAEFEKLNNTDKVILKDYDTETQMER